MPVVWIKQVLLIIALVCSARERTHNVPTKISSFAHSHSIPCHRETGFGIRCVCVGGGECRILIFFAHSPVLSPSYRYTT